MSQSNREERDRVLLVCDTEGKWYVRHVRVVEEDLSAGEKVYRCDRHLGGPYASLANVPQVQAALTAKGEACKAAVEKARREENEAAKALKPFVKLFRSLEDDGEYPLYPDDSDKRYIEVNLKVGDFRRACRVFDAIRSRLTARQGEAERPDTQKGEG